ncbi:MAG: hypothetical protein E6559_24475 [Pantoea sp.]|nr:hypothetical protein [Pantoea sp.]
MKGMSNEFPVSQGEIVRVLGQCCHITLNTGAEAFYINGQFITDSYPGEGAPWLLNLARSIAAASGHTLRCYVVSEPDDEEWAWNDVVDQLTTRARVDAAPLFTPAGPEAPRGLIARLLSSVRK